MGFDARQSIDAGLLHLVSRLEPIIVERLEPHLRGLPWTTVLVEMDKMRGKSPRSYSPRDLQSQLRVITERIGDLGFPFDDYSRTVSTLGGELRLVRNSLAHNDELLTIDAFRAHDFVVRLLKHFGDLDGTRAAEQLRDHAEKALAEEKGLTSPYAEGTTDGASLGAQVAPQEADDPTWSATPSELVQPDPSVLTRSNASETPTIGRSRESFEPWVVVEAGTKATLDDLPKKRSKEKVRSVASEIADYEGPISLARLTVLTARSFGVLRLSDARKKKLAYQVKQCGLMVDADNYVWPQDLDPQSWEEFRPNDSTVDRNFTDISPVEIANAMRFIWTMNPQLTESELFTATLQTFGRRRRTKQFEQLLQAARSRLR